MNPVYEPIIPKVTALITNLVDDTGVGKLIRLRLVYPDGHASHVYLDSDTAYDLSAQLLFLSAELDPHKVGL